MSTAMRQPMKARFPVAGWIAFACVCIAGYVALFGLYPRYFDLSWDEEVRLHDDSVILVRFKETYERRGPRLTRYDNSVRRRTQITFDAGPGIGSTTFATRLGIRLLDRVDGKWYVVLFGQGPYGNHPDEMPSRWGEDYTKSEERLATFRGGQFIPVSWDEAPPNAIMASNLLVSAIPIEAFAQHYNDGRLTLDDKARLRLAYPPGPDASLITRPVRFDKTKGGSR